ncbi:hypothetical protein ACQEVB_20780 [Pseudonocardia sp. CA-107938]|uniref:hypothetical protein n=1 Tax=Pseudonocardia sp. CA-107938 TaxID=3240021 RepID=UPI003D942BD4
MATEQNRLLRAARESTPSPGAPGEPMSRAELADAVNTWLWHHTGTRYELDDHLIGKWERGIVRCPIREYRAALRAVLGVDSDAALGFYSVRRTTASAAAVMPTAGSGPWTRDDIAVDATEAAQQYLISRRAAVRGAAAILGGPTLLAPLAPWLSPLADDPGLAARRGPFALAEVEAIESVTAGFRAWRSTAGLGRTAVVGQLADIVDRVHTAPEGPLTNRVFCAAAELAKISGAMGFDAGHYPSAAEHYVMAARLAKAGGNTSFGAVALAALARQLFDLGRPADGLEVVALAQRGTAHNTTPALSAMLATRQAWGHAQRGETYAFERAVDIAETAHSDADPKTEPRWLSGLDSAELAGVIGARYRDLARHEPRHAHNAIVYIGRAIATRDPRRSRNRALDMISLARSQVLTGDHEQSAVSIATALPLIDRARPGRLARKLADWHRETEPLTRVAAIRETRDIIRELLPTTA